MDRYSQSNTESPAQLSQVASISSQEITSNDVQHNKRELFINLVSEIEELRIKSLDLYGKFKSTNKPESVENDSSMGQYLNILEDKISFINHLTETVSSSNPSGNFKGKFDAYREFSSALQKCFKEGIKIEQQLQEEINTLTAKNKELDKQILTFSNLLQNSEDEPAASQQLNKQLKEARQDMNTVLTSLYPAEIVMELNDVMLTISNAYLENKENEEAQYVEIQPKNFTNKAFLCLLQANVVVRHPKNRLMVRLLSED